MKGGYCFGSPANRPAESEAYRFDTENGPVIIAWTNRADEHPIFLFVADGPRILLAREGQFLDRLTPTDGQITFPLTLEPQYVVWEE